MGTGHERSPAVHGLPSTPSFHPARALRLTFVEHKVVVPARFLATAPRTGDAIWELLAGGALETLALHGIWAGHELAAEIPPPRTPIPAENQSLYPAPGEILYWFIGLESEWQIGNSDSGVWYRLARAADTADAEAVVLACGGIRTAAILTALEDDLGKPVISAPAVSIWHALRLAGIKDRRPDRGLVFREL